MCAAKWFAMHAASTLNCMVSIDRIQCDATQFTHVEDGRRVTNPDEGVRSMRSIEFESILICLLLFCSASGSKAQDATNAAVPEQSSPDGFIDQADQHDLQAIQNHNLLIALGGVAARRASGAPHFSMPVSSASFYFITRSAP